MKSIKWKFLTLLVFSMIVFAACGEKTKSEKAKDKIENTAEEVGDLFRTEQEELEHDLNDARKNVEEKLEELKNSLANATDETKKGINRQINTLESHLKTLGNDIEQVGDQVADNWKNFKTDVKNRLNKIDKELDDKF